MKFEEAYNEVLNGKVAYVIHRPGKEEFTIFMEDVSIYFKFPRRFNRPTDMLSVRTDHLLNYNWQVIDQITWPEDGNMPIFPGEDPESYANKGRYEDEI